MRKWGTSLHEMHVFLQMIMQPFLYEILTITLVNKPNASTMQVQNEKMHKYATNKLFYFIFEVNDM